MKTKLRIFFEKKQLEIKNLQKELQDSYNRNVVKVKDGDIVSHLYNDDLSYVFIDKWKGRLCHTTIRSNQGVSSNQGASCGYNQVHGGEMHGEIFARNAFQEALNILQEDGNSKFVIDAFIEMNKTENEKIKSSHLSQRFCQWCGERLATDLVD